VKEKKVRMYVLEDTERGIRDGVRLMLSERAPEKDSPIEVRGSFEVSKKVAEMLKDMESIS
jgi:hypothetical protein